MNAERRKALNALAAEVRALCEKASDLRDKVEYQQSNEQDYFDNMPEAFQQGEKGTIAEDAINNLNDALSGVDEIQSIMDDIAASIEAAAA